MVYLYLELAVGKGCYLHTFGIINTVKYYNIYILLLPTVRSMQLQKLQWYHAEIFIIIFVKDRGHRRLESLPYSAPLCNTEFVVACSYHCEIMSITGSYIQ